MGIYTAGTSPFGVLDMAGKVQEWVADRYEDDYYSRSLSENPAGPENGTDKVTHDGSWDLAWG